MRTVSYEDLVEEQDHILFDAPSNNVVLIQGPPGCGKTIMAFHRAEALSEEFETVHVMMYNTVLSKFSSNATDTDNIEVKTMHSWMGRWWKSFMSKNHPQHKPFHPKYDEMFNLLIEKKSSGKLDLKKLNWGHLIIDEAQDFSNNRFEFLNQVRTAFFRDPDSQPSITILADENQMITDDNSTLDEIKSSFQIDTDEKVFSLKINHRNTDEINDFIQCFNVGLATGKAESSGIHGNKPEIVFSNNSSKTIDDIISYAQSNQHHEIGIIVTSEPDRRIYYDALNNKLDNTDFNVQTFRKKAGHTADLLDFDKEGTITVLHIRSCKGLEFDAVFIPNLSSMRINDADLDKFKMEMYVMCSRARKDLALYVDNEHSHVLNYLPSKQDDLMRYKNV